MRNTKFTTAYTMFSPKVALQHFVSSSFNQNQFHFGFSSVVNSKISHCIKKFKQLALKNKNLCLSKTLS